MGMNADRSDSDHAWKGKGKRRIGTDAGNSPGQADSNGRPRGAQDAGGTNSTRSRGSQGAGAKRARVQFNLDNQVATFPRAPSSSTAQGPSFEDHDDNDGDENADDDDPTLLDFDGTKRQRGKALRDQGEGSASSGSEMDADSDDAMDTGGPRARSDDDEDDDDDMITTKRSKHHARKMPLSRVERSAEERQQFTDADEAEAGQKFEPFNMRTEMAEGDFDVSGTYIPKRDQNARHDVWLTDISKREIQRAAVAQRAREQEREEHEREVMERSRLPDEPSALLQAALGIMQPRESVTTALQRLNSAIVRKRQRGNRQRSVVVASSSSTTITSSPEPEASKLAREDVELLTEIADRLLASGHAYIYDQDYEDILGDLRDDGLVDRSWQPTHPLSEERAASERVTWKYTWAAGGNDPEVSTEEYGPFETTEMAFWAEQGYFEGGISVQKYVNDVPFGPQKQSQGEMFLAAAPVAGASS